MSFPVLPKANILVIDDSDSVRKRVKEVLLQAELIEFCFEAKSGLEGFHLLLNKKVDLVICDVVMPEFDGFKFLLSRAARQELTEIPVLMLTGEGEIVNKIKALEQGASDYLTKPFDDGELVARVKVHLRIKFLQDELYRKNAELLEMAGEDPLTKAANRRRFMENAIKEFSHCLRYKQPMSFALFDIDHFKRINDEHGHIMGDTVIMEVTRALQQDIRTSDVVARYGGDELILLLPHTNCAGTLQLAERMRRKIELLEFGDGNHRIQVTVSCGISSYPESQAKTLEDMLRAADDALYRAKAAGRNRVEAHRADHGDTETQRA